MLLNSFAQKDSSRAEYVSVPKIVKADTLSNSVKLFVSISGGGSFPVGSYYLNAPITYTNPFQTQFAGFGPNFNMLVGMPLSNQRWEVQLSLSYISNSVDDADFLAAVSNPNGSIQGLYEYTVIEQNTSFNFYDAAASFARTFRTNHSSIDLKVLVGYTLGIFPHEHDYVIGSNGSLGGKIYADYSAPNYSALLYGIGAGGKTFISKTLYIIANVDLMFSSSVLSTISVNFSQPMTFYNNSPAVTETTLANNSPVKQINVSVGIGYAFLKNKKK